jgi:hypothetical protein
MRNCNKAARDRIRGHGNKTNRPSKSFRCCRQVARREVETLDLTMSLSTITDLKTLAKHVAARLGERTLCVVFEDDLERCWPSERLERAAGEKEIQSFARSQDWAAVILTVESGIRAIFRKPGTEFC